MGGGGGGGGKGGGREGGDSSYLEVVEKAVFVNLRVFSFKMSTAGAFSVLFRVPREKRTGYNMLGGIGTNYERKKIKRRPQNRILVSLRVSVQNFQRAPSSLFLHPGFRRLNEASTRVL